ncbi:hypothetical protein KEU06_18190 [Pseudaminobacter sp. 19-2017]|uniref:DUF995 domain-containing protein n=2 Tax=Pseudaminobacter soli (ex Zhang et al. 2022) TaxID=2831468 RepID=A0A942DZZ7_9HYPH|nr:hypothetical protein [Pseudaminobacter soli]
MFFRSLLSGAAFLVSLVSAASAADLKNLDNREIADELVGKQIAWWEEAGWRHGYLVQLPNGVAEMTVDRPQRQRDFGRWSLRGNEICTRWGEVRGEVVVAAQEPSANAWIRFLPTWLVWMRA